MEPVLAPYYARVRDRMSEAEFAAKLQETADSFGGLLDEEACALLLLDELGLNDGAYVTLADLAGRSEATVRVTLDAIEPPRTFQREGRPEGRVCNCVVSDATGQARMVLWDKDVDKAEDGTLRPKARLTLVHARVKEGRYGVELHVGPWSVIEVEGALDPAKRKLLADVAADAAEERPQELPTNVSGTLEHVAPTRTYRRADGGVGFACDVDVRTPEGLLRVVAWDEAVRTVRAIGEGKRVAFEGLVPRTRGALTEWHTGKETTIRAG